MPSKTKAGKLNWVRILDTKLVTKKRSLVHENDNLQGNTCLSNTKCLRRRGIVETVKNIVC